LIFFFPVYSQAFQCLKVQFTHLQNPYHENFEYCVIKKISITRSAHRIGQSFYTDLSVPQILQSRYQICVMPYGPAVSYPYPNLKRCICMARLMHTMHTVFCFVPDVILLGTFLTAAYAVGSQLEATRMKFDLPAPFRFPMTFLLY